MLRYVCVHGHFYQPPRENPWLEEVETEYGAAPYHDWNERITAECYRPNAWSRVLDDAGRISSIVNNYERISFDVGPTLLNWLERRAPDVYEAMLGADRASRSRFSGHGSAIAQGYNHQILPLAARDDKETQIAWGIRDFEDRFGRAPEGIWFPETAVDPESLELASAAGIRFTVLSPFQALRFRRDGAAEWTSPAPGGIPTTRPYRLSLPGDRSLAVFFYNGSISSDIAFHGLLHSGTAFADRLAGAFDAAREGEPQLAHVATDGETYGHHHRHGDMALSFALDRLDHREDIALTNYAEFLAQYPPTYEVELHTPSAWSCVHGVDRWRRNCGCNSGIHPGWNQEWRAPLRAALDHLRDAIRPPLITAESQLFRDPRRARQDYVELLRDRSEGRRSAFLARHASHALSPSETTTALSLLEIERQLAQMYTSCGWFFDDLAGIETLQVLLYAARAIQLAERTIGGSYEPAFLAELQAARSNQPQLGDGRAVFERFVAPARLSLRNVCAHYALSSLFEEYPEPAHVYCYTVRGSERRVATAGSARLAVGQAEVVSDITLESARFTYGALYIGGQNLFGGVRPFQGDGPFRATATTLLESFDRGDVPETIRRVDANFSEATYTLRLLFRDEQHKIVDLLFESMRDGVESSFRRIFESTAPILRNLADSGATAPLALRAASEFYLNDLVRRALQARPPDVEEVGVRLRELARMNLRVDGDSLALPWAAAAEHLLEVALANRSDRASLRALRTLVTLAGDHSVDVDFSRTQNRFYSFDHGEPLPPVWGRPGPDPEWQRDFRALGEALGILPA
jgi:alpha-amylase/alpha-mannosidase (GH57 family)